MVTTTFDVQSMVNAGNEQIAEIEAQTDALAKWYNTAESEIATRSLAREARAAQLHEVQGTLERLDLAYSQAVSYAKLACNTPKEHQSVKDVSTTKKEAQAARRAYEQCVRETTEASQRDDAREEALQKEIHLFMFKRETHERERREMRKGLDKAQAELGTLTYNALVPAYQTQQARVDALHEQLLAGQVERYETYNAGCAALAQWPDLQKAYAQVRPLEDATLRVMEATLYYANALLEDAENVVYDLPQTVLPDYQGTWFTLTIREQEVRDPARLRTRIEAITRTRDKYLDMLKAE